MKRKNAMFKDGTFKGGEFLLQGMVFKVGKVPEQQFWVLCYSYWIKIVGQRIKESAFLDFSWNN